jgi:tetratricopeptide (TPR) repeat protein
MKDDDSQPSQVEGYLNQVIANNFGTAFANVAGNVFLNQSPPRALSLHQLPADISDFTGRKDEIESILGHLNRGETVAISAVAGMPGVGKSALAIHVAHRLAVAEFPDVQLYIDLRGADGNALEPADVLAQWLRAFGLDESSIPKDLRERSSVFRSLLSGKRAIVVLDNARDEVQVRPLLPGSQTCVAIVTSRRVLGALEGSTAVNLQILSEPEAVELLERLIDKARVQQELAAARKIVQLCGRLPLAIRIVGGTLKTKRHWVLSEYAQRLADEKARLGHLKLSDLDVRASFELSYCELTDSDASLFRYLGILEGKDFGAELAEMLTQGAGDAKDAMERLLEVQLLEAISRNRYQFHDLIRVFAQKKLHESETLEKCQDLRLKVSQLLTERAVEFYNLLDSEIRLGISNRISQKRKEHIREIEERLFRSAVNWFAVEEEHLIAAVSWIKTQKEWEMLRTLISCLSNPLRITCQWNKLEKITIIGLDSIKESNNQRFKIACQSNLGLCYLRQIKLEESKIIFLELLNKLNEKDDVYISGVIKNNIGIIYQEQRDFPKALDYFFESLKIFQGLDQKEAIANCFNNIGVIYRASRKFVQAIDLFQQSVQIFFDLGDRHGASNALNNIGAMQHDFGSNEKAIECFQKSLTLSAQLGDLHGVGQALGNLGIVFHDQGKHEEALDLYTKSRNIFREINNKTLEAEHIKNIGTIYAGQEDYDNAINSFTASISIFEIIDNLYGVAHVLLEIGRLHVRTRQWTQAQNNLEESLDLFEKFDDSIGKGRCLAELGDLHHHQENLENAETYYRNSITFLWKGHKYNQLTPVICKLSIVLRKLQRLNEAEELLRKSLNELEHIEDRNLLTFILDALAEICKYQGQAQEAEDCYYKVLGIKRDLGDSQGEGLSLLSIGALFANQNDLKRATLIWQEALTKVLPESPEYQTLTEWLESVQLIEE